GLGDQPARMAGMLRAAGIAVRWAPPRFDFDHAKVILLDSRLAIISTANFSRAGFASDRDVVIFDRQGRDIRGVSAIFRADWDRLPASVADANLVVSPDNARQKLGRLIAGARRSIDIYAEEFVDRRFARVLMQAAARHVRVRVLLPPGAAPVRRAGIAVRTLSRPYIHAKVIMVDGRETFVGSENLSPVSLAKNREIGILLRGVNRRLERVFGRDWVRARRALR
ncbi:MAG TPA: phospholipase D-like domain-containing protein, partial [Chloroflexota bacterium]|nr:phospholipase D-like domain-containing protein [Chloroflexota bacterium]